LKQFSLLQSPHNYDFGYLQQLLALTGPVPKLSFKSKRAHRYGWSSIKVRKETLLILAVCLGTLFIASFFIWNLSGPQIPQKYERKIVRNFENQEEERALIVAESINYSSVVSSERFTGSSDPEAYLHPGTYLTYTYANFIDSEVINYYEARYNSLQGKGDPKQIELNYEANATKQSEFRIFNSPAPEGVTWHNITVVISTSDGSFSLRNSGQMKFFYKNQSSYQMIGWGYDFNFSDCYAVEMKLVYSETYAPLAAFWSDAYQIVVLDQNFVPVLLGVESQNVVA
jgi:hypothetical protein